MLLWKLKKKKTQKKQGKETKKESKKNKQEENSQSCQCVQFGCITCRLPCLEEQLLVLLEGDNIFWDAPKFFSSLMIQGHLFHISSLRMSLKGNQANVLEDS